MAVDFKCAGVDELADGFDGVRVALDHLFGDGFCSAVVAVDPHGGEHCSADNLMEKECKQFIDPKWMLVCFLYCSFKYLRHLYSLRKKNSQIGSFCIN